MSRVLLDTNIVARLLPRPASNEHVIIGKAVAQLRNEQHELFLVPQVLYEFWVVATRPVERNGFGLTPTEAAQDAHRLQSLFALLRDERSVFDHWQEIVVQHSISGKGGRPLGSSDETPCPDSFADVQLRRLQTVCGDRAA